MTLARKNPKCAVFVCEKMEHSINAWELKHYGIRVRLRSVEEENNFYGVKIQILKDKVVQNESLEIYQIRDLSIEFMQNLRLKLLNKYRPIDWQLQRELVKSKLLQL
jgi:hypothetical protein